jgi:hypothetical protein
MPDRIQWVLVQLLVAILLSVFYGGLSRALDAVYPNNIVWWFLVPIVGLGICLWFVSERMIAAALPIHWQDGRPFGPTPRSVHVSWRTAVRVPVAVPFALFPTRLFSILLRGLTVQHEPALRWVVSVLLALALLVLAVVVRSIRRELRLLRHGDVAMALVESRDDDGEGPATIRYFFATDSGVAVRGKSVDHWYRVPVGDTVPIFYDPNNPKDRVAACGCWLEVD